MNTDALVELCDRLDMQAAILAIIGGERIDVDLYLKTSAGLREALAEIERLKSDAAALPKALAENKRLLRTATELQEARTENERLKSEHLKTAADLWEARAEIEHLRSDADLHLKTNAELREAHAENERLRSDAVVVPARSDADAELYRDKVDRGINTSAFWPTDWFSKFLNLYNAKNGLK
jgi:hypothetical protein